MPSWICVNRLASHIRFVGVLNYALKLQPWPLPTAVSDNKCLPESCGREVFEARLTMPDASARVVHGCRHDVAR